MILSASRRTDIPAYYSDWFLNRMKEGFVFVRNPMNIHQISRIRLSPDVVDCIVFWTKNPRPMLDKLYELKDYHYYFQFTLNSYDQDAEANLPSKYPALIDAFKELSGKIGKEKVIWRYDPIFISRKYNIKYHLHYFEKLARSLKDHTEKCTISFIDFYHKIGANVKELGIVEISEEQKRLIAEGLSGIAFSYGLRMDTCAEDIALDDLKIAHARCIDDRLISRITGSPIQAEKDKNQRSACGCAASIDIGLYNTCRNGCKYCYANHNLTAVKSNSDLYDASSPLLCSKYDPNADTINERRVSSQKQDQMRFL
jgi:Domain of unknown function (DUF1848).